MHGESVLGLCFMVDFLVSFSSLAIIVPRKRQLVALFGLMLYVTVNSYGHVGTVSSPNNTFFQGKLD